MKILRIFLMMSIFSLIGCEKENELIITLSPPLKKADFKIELQALGSERTVNKIFDGNNQFKILNEYGENDWFFSYKDSLYTNFRHFKTNRNDKHTYSFNFFEKDSVIYVNVHIKGISGLKKTLTFTTIKKQFR